jgi:signal peptidase
MKMKKTLKIIGNVLFYSISGLLFISILLELFAPDKTIDIIGFKGFVVVSGSMEPVINVNDLVIVTKTKASTLEPGDIISFYAYLPTILEDDQGNTIYEKNVVTHYLGELITSGEETIIRTYGTANAPGEFDQWNDINGEPTDLTTNDILGKVTLTIPKVGFIVLFAMILVQNPVFLALVVTNIIIIVILIKVIRKPKGKNI